MNNLLSEVESFLKAYDVAPTTFGWETLNDPNFVWNLRKGRDCKETTVKKVRKYMRKYEEQREIYPS